MNLTELEKTENRIKGHWDLLKIIGENDPEFLKALQRLIYLYKKRNKLIDKI